MKPNNHAGAALALLALTCAPLTAGEVIVPQATAPPLAAEESEWQFNFRPYVWFTGLEGTIGANGATAPVDMEFDDILENLDMVWSSTLEARRGKWGVMLDFTYLKISGDTVPVFTGPPIAPYGFEVEMYLVDLVGSYRGVEWNGGFLDFTGGVRWMSIENTINLANPAGPIGSAGASDDWFDPHVGLRLHQDLGARTYFRIFGDVGGFGVGSDITYQGLAALGYRMNDCLSVELGYRYLKEDYDNGATFSFDAEMQGPILGISYAW
ncbi:outer membrane protein [Haloferula sp.]|uniref:outer membrane protein n=1 Tax=Haloferula sp. TaxID=2497595 RepID=UPI00329D7F58